MEIKRLGKHKFRIYNKDDIPLLHKELDKTELWAKLCTMACVICGSITYVYPRVIPVFIYLLYLDYVIFSLHLQYSRVVRDIKRWKHG